MGTTFSSCGDNCVRKEQLVEVSSQIYFLVRANDSFTQIKKEP